MPCTRAALCCVWNLVPTDAELSVPASSILRSSMGMDVSHAADMSAPHHRTMVAAGSEAEPAAVPPRQSVASTWGSAGGASSDGDGAPEGRSGTGATQQQRGPAQAAAWAREVGPLPSLSLPAAPSSSSVARPAAGRPLTGTSEMIRTSVVRWDDSDAEGGEDSDDELEQRLLLKYGIGRDAAGAAPGRHVSDDD